MNLEHLMKYYDFVKSNKENGVELWKSRTSRVCFLINKETGTTERFSTKTAAQYILEQTTGKTCYEVIFFDDEEKVFDIEKRFERLSGECLTPEKAVENYKNKKIKRLKDQIEFLKNEVKELEVSSKFEIENNY